MSTDQVSDTPTETVKAKPRGKDIKVPIVKGKAMMTVNTADLPDHVYMEALSQGLKVLMNRGMTKITKAEYPVAAELQAAAMAKAETILSDLKAGKVRIVGGKGDGKLSGAVKTEAMRIARALVKDELKRQKIKISYVDAKDITAMAENILRANEVIIEQAKANIAARDAEAEKLKEGLAQIVTPGMINKTKQAKGEAEKAAAKAALEAAGGATISAAQAGQVAQRAPKAAKPGARA